MIAFSAVVNSRYTFTLPSHVRARNTVLTQRQQVTAKRTNLPGLQHRGGGRGGPAGGPRGGGGYGGPRGGGGGYRGGRGGGGGYGPPGGFQPRGG